MASISKRQASHATLSGTTADTVTLTGSFATVQIVNRDASVPLYATYTTEGSTPTTAVSEADNTYVIPANGMLTVRATGTGFVTSVVGNGNAYSVVGYQFPQDHATFGGPSGGGV